MGRKRKNAAIFADMCRSVQKRMFAFDYSVDEQNGTAELILDSVHRIKLAHLSLFPSVQVTYRQDDRRYVLQTHASAAAMRHNAMLVEYARMADFYGISDITSLKGVIEAVHSNASVCFHKVVKQGDVFIAVFTVPKTSHEMRLNTGVINDIDNISSSWIELHPDSKELRLCVSLIPESVPRRKRKRDDTQGCGDHAPPRQRARVTKEESMPPIALPPSASAAMLAAVPPSSSSSSYDETRQSSRKTDRSWSRSLGHALQSGTPQY